MKKTDKQTPMEKLTQGYEKFIKGKDTKEANQGDFDKALKKISKPKPKK
jgi:hypothetical protein